MPGTKTVIGALIIVIVVGIIAVAYFMTAPPAKETGTPAATPTTSPTPAAKKVISIGTTDKISRLDPAYAYDFFTWEIMQNTYEGLFKYKPGTTELEVTGIVDSYNVSPDGLVWTFKLKPGLKFSNGKPLNASVFKYSIERVIERQQDVSWMVTEFVENVTVVDELTFKIYLKDPVSFFPALLATPPYFPVDPSTFPKGKIVDGLVGNGPFKIVEWKRDEYLILEPNPYYTGKDEPKVDRVVVKFYADATQLKLALERGDIDIAWRTLNPPDIKAFKENPNFKVYEVPGPFIRYIVINTKTPPCDNKLVRQALAAAINRTEIAEVVYMGTVTPLFSMIPEGMWSHIDAFKDKYGAEGNITLARQILIEAGYSEENKLKIELWYTPTHYGDLEDELALMLKEQWEKTGLIEVTLKSAEWGTYVDYIEEGTMPVFLLGWYPDYVDPDDYTSPFLIGEAMGSFYNNSYVVELLREARTEMTMEERSPLYVEVQKITAEDVPQIPLVQGYLVLVAKPEVKGIVLDATMIFRYYLLDRG